MYRLTVFVLLIAATLLIGCTARPFTFREAPRPAGWPDLTPPRTVEVKRYPAYRAAVAEAPDAEDVSDSQMFWRLFSHIKSRDIPMTAPVEMTYNGDEPQAMSFLYRTTDVGETGEAEDGVRVIDVPAQTVASVGVRGRYRHWRFECGVDRLNTWLADDGTQWVAAGEPRYLGYNSPFIPGILRYGEVQIPIEPK
jgi:hypothetical protein